MHHHTWCHIVMWHHLVHWNRTQINQQITWSANKQIIMQRTKRKINVPLCILSQSKLGNFKICKTSCQKKWLGDKSKDLKQMDNAERWFSFRLLLSVNVPHRSPSNMMIFSHLSCICFLFSYGKVINHLHWHNNNRTCIFLCGGELNALCTKNHN